MTSMVEMIQSVVRHELQKLHLAELGVVESVYPHSEESDRDNYQCDVRLKNKDVVLRRVQVATQHIGLANIPHVGDLVLMTFVNGDVNAPIVVGRLYNDEDRPPLSKMEEIIYEAPYSRNPDLRRIRVRLPQGTVTISIYDNRINAHAGGSSVSMDAGGNIALETSARSGRSRIAMSDSGSIDLQTMAGGIPCSIKADGNGLEIETAKDITLTANRISITAGQEFTVTAGVKAGIAAGGYAEVISGGDLSITGTANTVVKGGALAQLMGGPRAVVTGGDVEVTGLKSTKLVGGTTTSVESKGDLAIRGAVVRIN